MFSSNVLISLQTASQYDQFIQHYIHFSQHQYTDCLKMYLKQLKTPYPLLKHASI